MVACSKCKLNLMEDDFTTTQLRKPSNKRKCKRCASGAAPSSAATVAAELDSDGLVCAATHPHKHSRQRDASAQQQGTSNSHHDTTQATTRHEHSRHKHNMLNTSAVSQAQCIETPRHMPMPQ